MIPSSAPQEVEKHEKQQGNVFQKDKPRLIYRKGPSRIRTDRKESQQLSGESYLGHQWERQAWTKGPGDLC